MRMLMSEHGHRSRYCAAKERAFEKQIPTLVVPELDSQRPLCPNRPTRGLQRPSRPSLLSSPGKLAKTAPPNFSDKFDRFVVHNMFTMPFNLAGTQALSGLAEQGIKTIAWTHDLAASNPDYKIPPIGRSISFANVKLELDM